MRGEDSPALLRGFGTPVWEGEFMFAPAVMNGLVIGVIYALAALGVSLVVGIMNVVNFAHGELYILAGYFSYLLANTLGIHFVAAMVLAVFFVFILGLLIEYTLIRPTYGNEMYSLILTFILSIVLQNAYLLIFGPYPNKPPGWISGATSIFGSFYYGNQRLAALVAGVVVIFFVFLIINKTWFGRIIRATSMDRQMAELNGVNTVRLNMLSFGLGCALAGAAGVILAPVFPVTPSAGVPVALTAIRCSRAGRDGLALGLRHRRTRPRACGKSRSGLHFDRV